MAHDMSNSDNLWGHRLTTNVHALPVLLVAPKKEVNTS